MLKLSQYLNELGVESIYFCAGARNAGLLKTFNTFEVKHRFDERSAAFEALGETKLTKAPVAICMTSGTAVSECLPAVIESYYSDEKLIIISADRPERLRFSHAPQAINQIDLFKNFTRFSFSGKLADFKKSSNQFPMHVNIEIDDTVVSKSDTLPFDLGRNDFENMSVCFLISEGHGLSKEHIDGLGATNAHIYIEVLANLVSLNLENEIIFEKDLLKNYENNAYDAIIKVGKTPVTKLWRTLEQRPNKTKVFSSNSRTTGLSYGELIAFEEIKLNFKAIDLSLVTKATNTSELNLLLQKFEHAEPAKIFTLLNSLASDTIVFVGNSMPIRYVEMLKLLHLDYFASRGANGIDGQIATAIGIARNTKKEVHAVLGDLTFLYDANNILYNFPENLTIHIIDNSGGRIFQRVNVPKEIVHEHSIDFYKIISGLNLEKNIKQHIVSNSETELFWADWLSDEKQ
jgi:2-succinyl-5-enolpyruvyl-6-hydroxy-3-cyclohexene-1-carboxylate synthase